ncbi:hypothetical protein DM02DRAFT_31709 [Periconia macrospinosa]|uniref:Uncharacterized protein n=1 Tax=Periconia macrospinosa TaxID=97972 RepID=A0A2V1DNL4_9PLEO|nr:hypothetical protein DM02DRAFT_31709 [Periconia macrospinosa]
MRTDNPFMARTSTSGPDSERWESACEHQRSVAISGIQGNLVDIIVCRRVVDYLSYGSTHHVLFPCQHTGRIPWAALFACEARQAFWTGLSSLDPKAPTSQALLRLQQRNGAFEFQTPPSPTSKSRMLLFHRGHMSGQDTASSCVPESRFAFDSLFPLAHGHDNSQICACTIHAAI